MKKGTKICMIGVALIGAGLLFGMIGFAFGGRVTGIGFNENGINVYTPYLNQQGDKIRYVEEEMDLEAFEEIEVQLAYADFTIEPSDHYGISYRVKEGYFTQEVINGKLNVTQDYQKSGNNVNWFLIGGITNITTTYDKEYIIVYVPKDTLLKGMEIYSDGGDVDIAGTSGGNVCVEADYGNVSMEGIKGEDVTINMSSGNLEVASLSADTVTIDNDYGEVSLKDTVLEKMAQINVSSGDLELDKVKAPEFEARNDYGDIRGEVVNFAWADFNLSSGECVLKKFDTDHVNIDADYGNVRLELIQPIEVYGYDIRTDYGDVYLGNRDMGEQYTSLKDTMEKSIVVDCSSGDVEVYQGR